jgi:MOSC domain-containing protein YiiM
MPARNDLTVTSSAQNNRASTALLFLFHNCDMTVQLTAKTPSRNRDGVFIQLR